MSDKNRRLGSLRLNFSNCRLSLPKLLDALEGLPCERVEELDASQNDLGDEAPGKILRLLPLRALRLNSAGLSAQGLRSAIEAITQPWLEQDKCREGELSLSSSGLLGSKSPGADGLSLRPSQSLQVLELAACSADAAVPDLALYLASQCCTLTELDLSWNTLGPHAVQELSLHLRQNTTLRSLRLAHCHLKQAAGVLLACLSTSSLPLERLGLARNGMPYSAFEELACFLGSAVGQQLIDLDLSGNKAVAEEPCSRVLGRALCRVQDVESSYASFRGAELKLSLAGTKPFFDAAYGRWDAGPQLLTILRSPGRVLDVNLDHCTFAEAAIPSLARICLNVRNFSLCQCSGGEGTLGQSFAVHLEDLARGLGRRRSERSGGSSIAGALSGIEPEVRGRERQLPLRLLLRELRLNELGLQDGSAQLLSHALAWLRLARRDRADVEVLELEGNHLTHEGVIALADLLENSPLRRLSLSRNKLRPLGGMCMGDLLAARPPQASWLDLELQRCSLGEGVVHLWQQVLSGNARIRRLNLADNAVDAATVEVLLDAAALSPACPEELELLPNPCGSRVVAKLLHHLAPWRTISLKGASPEVAEVAQLLSSFGDQKDATCSRDKPSEFVLSLGNTLKVPPGHWELLGDALKVATCPVTQLPGAARPGTAPFRRLGGCGGILYLEFRDCDLSQAFFRVPRAITPENVELSSIAKSARREWSVKAAERMPSAKSLATRARSAAGEDAVRTPSSRAPFRPAPRVADKCQGPEAAAMEDPRLSACVGHPSHVVHSPGATEAPGSEPSSPRSGARCPHRPVPPLRVCREENFTPLFERHEHVDLQASSVLRELRNVQGLRLLQCGLTDGWLAKLGHSGSSKWSGVRMLDLRCNQLTSASSSALASVVSGGLQALVLDGNRLQSVGFKAICTALTGKKCALRWLSVANNDLTHPSGSAAAEVLGSACPLQELSLAMNPKISSGEICTLLRAAARSQAHLYLDLAQTGAAAQVLPFAAKALARCEGLVIDLSGCPAIAEGSAEGPNLERFLADQRLLL